jgi:nitrogen-specific signal transduction histidine kinase
LEVGVSGGFALLTPDLHVKAIYPDSGSITAVEHRGADVERRLYLEDRGVGTLAVLRRNPWFPFVRYGPGLLLILVPVGTVLLVGYMRRLQYRLRIVHAAGMERLEAGGYGLMVLDARGRVRWRGPGLAEKVRADRRSASSLRELATLEPSLADWCREVVEERPARRRTSTVALEGADAARQATVSMSPVVIGSSHDPHWILSLDESGGATERAWPMMAQRIAHAVKNPLTHMLLTVQRLQVEYRERAPAVASRLDPYADRIQDGIGQLRRLTSSFLKLVDLAEPELEETDVEDMVNDLAEQFRAQLPHDIQLRVEVGERPPKARLDREQVQVALDNLCTNAVNALESGGTITLSVGAVRGVRLDGSSVPEDFVQIEVMDTGKGITADAGDSIFEPGFTTAEDGSGLGLAIVRKIVADHRGRVSFESEKGVGTVFTVQLPVSGPSPAGEEQA